MIIQALLDLLFLILDGIIALLPEGFTIPNWIDSVIYFFNGVGYFFPKNSISVVIAALLGWAGFYIIWKIVHYIIRKIRG